MLEICKQIESIPDEKERLKYALGLSQKGIVLCPLLCVMSSIPFSHYYKLFKVSNARKTRLIKELEDNFQYINID